MKLGFKGVFRLVVFAHVVGIAVLVLLSCVAMFFSYPSECVILVGVLSLSFGAVFLGFYFRGQGASFLDSLLGGALYTVVCMITSLFSKGEGLSIGYRFILLAVSFALILLPSRCFKKKKKYRRIRR